MIATSLKLLVIGLFLQIDYSESRAVNIISNTWTLPEPGFAVFYRYFRDKISWFEADAVCQFHHANLVTVENSEQFDAARNFLKELDVTDSVWIGLMRPTNADRFSWTNSKPLPPSQGYWADQLPVVESPLCAVIDPVRDYRWHALRCGGPETAAFLCEMEIPEWAVGCTQRPDMTVQYMSDSGSVQLSRRCNDSIREISCQGRSNQETMYDELKCPEEMMTTSTEGTTIEITEKTTVESTTTEEYHPEVILKNPQKMMEDIFNSQTIHDDEIDMQVNSNRLETPESKKDDDDLMLGDQPITQETEDKKTLLKKTEKKEIYTKKSKLNKKEAKSKEIIIDDEQMMGDQPASEHETSSNIALTTDRQRRDINSETTIATDVATSQQEETTQKLDEGTTTAVPVTSTTLAPVTTTLAEELTSKHIAAGHPLHQSQAVFKDPVPIDLNGSHIAAGHPLHQSQAVFKDPIPVEIINGTHDRKEVNPNEDHFIPPMLLVKARFTSTKATEGITETEMDSTTQLSTSPISASEPSTDEQTVTEITQETNNSTTELKEANNEIPSQNTEVVPTLPVAVSEKPILLEKRHDPRHGLNTITTTTVATTVELTAATTVEQTEATSSISVENIKIVSVVEEHDLTTMPQTTEETSTSVTEQTSTETPTSSEVSTAQESTSQSPTSTAEPKIELEKLIESTTTIPLIVSTSTIPIMSSTPMTIKITTLKAPEITTISSTSTPTPSMAIVLQTAPMKNDIDLKTQFQHNIESHEINNEMNNEHDDDNNEHEHNSENNFSNIEDFQPYKPNRHRELSKQDVHHGGSFSIGRILG
ncbi:unnamed protein product [Diamesa hyperborea]